MRDADLWEWMEPLSPPVVYARGLYLPPACSPSNPGNKLSIALQVQDAWLSRRWLRMLTVFYCVSEKLISKSKVGRKAF